MLSKCRNQVVQPMRLGLRKCSAVPAWRKGGRAAANLEAALAGKSVRAASASGGNLATAEKKLKEAATGGKDGDLTLGQKLAAATLKRLEDAKALGSRVPAKLQPLVTQATATSGVDDATRKKLLDDAIARDLSKCVSHKGNSSDMSRHFQNVKDAMARDLLKNVHHRPDGKLSEATARDLSKCVAHSPEPATQSNFDRLLAGYGEHVFKGDVANKYLAQAGLPAGTIEAGAWHKDPATADKVAVAICNWATDNGASVFCHWFQPMGGAGVRHGQSGQVQNAFFNFDKSGQPVWDLKGKDLIQGETDGSSYPTGGLRATHTAGGYLSIDPTSPMYLRGDTVFIPSTLTSYHGHAIDEKTPLLRSVEAMNREGTRLLNLLGYKVSGLQSHIGLEQEFFLVPRKAYLKRPDLQMAGRTVMGMDAPRGQEMCDHYMGPPSLGSNPALDCMIEGQEQCYKLGIPLKTRHREVAPGQYEHAPHFGTVTTQIDQNIVVMQILEEVASKHGLACLLHEKPFDNVNGSGKHNNWSLITDDGVNLLNAKQVTEASGSGDIFPVIMSAVIAAVDEYGDLMRMAIASPGNDFRLGACEAPPAIISTYLGETLTNFLKDYKEGKSGVYKPATIKKNVGAKGLTTVEVPAEDRNRTSPFPYGGHRFEFRAVGSSQNVSLVNTVLNTMCAKVFKQFADALQGGHIKPQFVASYALDHHWKVIFNGNCYDEHWQNWLKGKGVSCIDSTVDAICKFTDPHTMQLFSSMGVLSPEECASRQTVMLEHYTGTVEIEANIMVQMIQQHVIPSLKKAAITPEDSRGVDLIESLGESVNVIKAAMRAVHSEEDPKQKAEFARMLRLEDMVEIRSLCDAAEAVVPADLWTLSTYSELLFLDMTTK